MMQYASFEITSAGATINIPYTPNGYQPIRVYSTGTVTLAGPVVIAVAGTVQPNMPIPIRWDAKLNLNSQSVTVCGTSLPQDIVNQPGMIEVVNGGSSYQVQYAPDNITRPQDNPGVTVVNVPTSGTLTVKPGTDKSVYYLVGAPTTLAGNYTVSVDTTGLTDSAQVSFLIGAGTTIGANTFTVEGEVVSAFNALYGGTRIDCVYSSTASAMLVTNVNSISVGGLDASALGSSDDGKVVQYNYSTGQFEAAFLKAANFGTAFSPVYFVKTRVPASEVLALNAKKKTLVAAPGSGKYIRPVYWDLYNDFQSTAYATNTDIALRIDTATEDIAVDEYILLSTGNRILSVPFTVTPGSTTASQYVTNKALQLYAKGGNPTAGDSDIFSYLWYTIVTL